MKVKHFKVEEIEVRDGANHINILNNDKKLSSAYISEEELFKTRRVVDFKTYIIETYGMIDEYGNKKTWKVIVDDDEMLQQIWFGSKRLSDNYDHLEKINRKILLQERNIRTASFWKRLKFLFNKWPFWLWEDK